MIVYDCFGFGCFDWYLGMFGMMFVCDEVDCVFVVVFE